MAINIIYPENGERRELPPLGNNQLPFYIHATLQHEFSGGFVDFDWSFNDVLIDPTASDYYQPLVTAQHLFMPHEGFYHVNLSMTLYPDPSETGDFGAAIFDSSHFSYPAGAYNFNATPMVSTNPYQFTVSALDYWLKGDYVSITLDSSDMIADYYIDIAMSIAAVT